MKKTKFVSCFLSALLILSVVAVPTAAADVIQGSSGGTATVSYTNDSMWTATIPTYIVPSESGHQNVSDYAVTIKDVVIPYNSILTATVEYSGNVREKNGVEIPYTLYTEDGAISSGDIILKATGGVQSHTTSVSFGASVDEKPRYAGIYTDTATFSFSVGAVGGIDPSLYAPIESAYAPKNMFDSSTLLNGYALDLNGKNDVVSAPTHSATQEIEVEAGKDYIVTVQSNEGVSCRTMCILNDNTVVYPFFGKSYSSARTILTMPENCKAIRFSATTEKIETLSFVPAPTIRVAVNGDSITQLSYGWAKNVCEYYYWDYTNYAIGGSALCSWGRPGVPSVTHSPLIERYEEMDTSADICMIAIGTNDWWYSWAPIGEDSDETTSTFKGALHSLCKGLKKMYGNKPIIFLTPMKRGNKDFPKNYPYNDFGSTLEDYANAIIDVCSQYDGISVIDIYHNCPVDPSIPEHLSLFFNGSLNINEGYDNLFNDTTHPNVYGARVQARYVIEGLNPIISSYISN